MQLRSNYQLNFISLLTWETRDTKVFPTPSFWREKNISFLIWPKSICEILFWGKKTNKFVSKNKSKKVSQEKKKNKNKSAFKKKQIKQKKNVFPWQPVMRPCRHPGLQVFPYSARTSRPSSLCMVNGGALLTTGHQSTNITHPGEQQKIKVLIMI